MDANAVLETVDYTEQIERLYDKLDAVGSSVSSLEYDITVANQYLGYISGFLLFVVVVALCVFGYKLIRLFV